MKRMILAISTLSLMSSAAFAAPPTYKCNQTYNDEGHVIHRPGKLVVKFNIPPNLASRITGKIWYRGDLNGADETLRVKTSIIGGPTFPTYHLPGGGDASNDNNAPGSTYDPNFLYKETSPPGSVPGARGRTTKLVFKLNAGDDTSWAVVKKVKLFMMCSAVPQT